MYSVAWTIALWKMAEQKKHGLEVREIGAIDTCDTDWEFKSWFPNYTLICSCSSCFTHAIFWLNKKSIIIYLRELP
jgi:hypothetical protein